MLKATTSLTGEMWQSAAKSEGFHCFFSDNPSWFTFLLLLRADRILLFVLKFLLHHKLSSWHHSPTNDLQASAISTSVPLREGRARSHSWHFRLTQFSAWMSVSTSIYPVGPVWWHCKLYFSSFSLPKQCASRQRLIRLKSENKIS